MGKVRNPQITVPAHVIFPATVSGGICSRMINLAINFCFLLFFFLVKVNNLNGLCININSECQNLKQTKLNRNDLWRISMCKICIGSTIKLQGIITLLGECILKDCKLYIKMGISKIV